MSSSTLPGLLLERAATTPTAVALRYFRHGKWNEVTFADLRSRAAGIGNGLVANGLVAGDVVAVIAEDGPLCFAAELGAQGIGVCVLALDPDLSAAEVLGALRQAGAVSVIVGDQEQFDKVDESRVDVPDVRLLVIDATRGVRHLDDAERPDRKQTATLAQLEASALSDGWDVAAAAVQPSDDARVIDGRRISHESVVDEARGLVARLQLTGSDVLCALHPFAEPTEHSLSVAGPMLTGAVLHFRGRATTQQVLRQVQPTVVHMTPRWLAGISADVEAQTQRATGVKRIALARGIRRRPAPTVITTGRRMNIVRVAGVGAAIAMVLLFVLTVRANDVLRVGLALAIVLGVGAALVLSGNSVGGPLRRRYGLARCRGVLTTDGTDVVGADLLGALDVPLIDLSLLAAAQEVLP